jgi:Phytanoyl-CoA dioxygenase (PhyH)
MLPPVEIRDSSFGIGVDVSELQGPWLSADYEIGDALFFHSLTVHRALPNRGDTIRVSIDCRAQPWSHPIQTDSLRPYAHAELSLKWGELYENWNDDSLKYYWRKRRVTLSAYNGDMFPLAAFKNGNRAAAVGAKNETTDVL